MITHRDKQIKEQLPTLFHLDLHSPAALEGVSAADDEREVVGTELGVGVGGVGVGEAGGREDGGDLDAGLESLLAKGEAF